MLGHSLVVLLTLLCSMSYAACIPRAISTPSFTVKQLGDATSSFSNVTIERDGGGGGLVNGKHFVLFSDTTTRNAAGNMAGFTSNSIVQLDSQNPQNMTEFGSNSVPSLAIPFEQNETEYCKMAGCIRTMIWPAGNIVTLNNGTAITVSGVSVMTNETAQYGTGEDIYNTMVTINANNGSTPKLERKVIRLFDASELQWGSYGLLMNPVDGKLNLFARAKSGIKVAAVDPAYYADRSKYTYWDGLSWSATQPKPDSSNGDLFSGLYSGGDFFWSPHLNTFVSVYMNGFADNNIFMRYSLDASLTGKWSDEIKILSTTPALGSKFPYNYGGHAYPSFDPTGQTLLLSWTYNGTTIQMAQVKFESIS